MWLPAAWVAHSTGQQAEGGPLVRVSKIEKTIPVSFACSIPVPFACLYAPGMRGSIEQVDRTNSVIAVSITLWTLCLLPFKLAMP